MGQLGPVLGIGGVIAFIAGIVYIAWLLEKKRTEAMSAYAQTHGYAFEGERPSLVDELTAFKLFNQGRRRTVKNLMRGAKDVGGVRICDYQYTTGSGKHQTVWNQTICLLQTPGRAAPHFFCRRQRALFDSLGKLFGGQIFGSSFDLLVSDIPFRVGLDGLSHGSRWFAWASKGIDSRCPLLADHPVLATPRPALRAGCITTWTGLGPLLSD